MKIGRGDSHWFLFPVLFSLLVPALFAQTAPPTSYPNYPSETPRNFKPVQDAWDYTRREVMVPMRDGIKLHTVILVPRGAKNAPILLTRTPYDASALTYHIHSSHLGPNLYGYD